MKLCVLVFLLISSVSCLPIDVPDDVDSAERNYPHAEPDVPRHSSSSSLEIEESRVKRFVSLEDSEEFSPTNSQTFFYHINGNEDLSDGNLIFNFVPTNSDEKEISLNSKDNNLHTNHFSTPEKSPEREIWREWESKENELPKSDEKLVYDSQENPLSDPLSSFFELLFMRANTDEVPDNEERSTEEINFTKFDGAEADVVKVEPNQDSTDFEKFLEAVFERRIDSLPRNIPEASESDENDAKKPSAGLFTDLFESSDEKDEIPDRVNTPDVISEFDYSKPRYILDAQPPILYPPLRTLPWYSKPSYIDPDFYQQRRDASSDVTIIVGDVKIQMSRIEPQPLPLAYKMFG